MLKLHFNLQILLIVFNWTLSWLLVLKCRSRISDLYPSLTRASGSICVAAIKTSALIDLCYVDVNSQRLCHLLFSFCCWFGVLNFPWISNAQLNTCIGLVGRSTKLSCPTLGQQSFFCCSQTTRERHNSGNKFIPTVSASFLYKEETIRTLDYQSCALLRAFIYILCTSSSLLWDCWRIQSGQRFTLIFGKY